MRLWGKAFSGRGTLSRRYTPMSRRWGESEAVLLGVREDWSYVRAARGWLGARTEPRCRLTPSSGLSRKEPGVACWEPGGPGGAEQVGVGTSGCGASGRHGGRRALQEEQTPGKPWEDAPFPCTSLFCIVHISAWPAVAVEETDLPTSLPPARLPSPPALIAPWPWPHSVRPRASSTERADSGAVPWDRKV